jgi:heptosyltransferase-2/heptosyltransferase-3
MSRYARPLVVRCGAFGDMVLVTALIRDLAARFGSAVDVLTTGSWSEPLLHGQPGVGEIICVRSRKSPYWLSRTQWHAVRRLRSRGDGPVWYCDGDVAARSMLARAGIADEFIVDVKQHPLRAGEHATQQWRRLAQILPARGAESVVGSGAPSSTQAAETTGGCQLDVSEGQRADVEAWLSMRTQCRPAPPVIAVQMGNKRTMRRGPKRLAANHKYWPAERWAVVLRHVRARHPEHAILLLGAGPEYELNQDLVNSTHIDRLYNAADDLPVPRLVALLERAQALITVDSGPAHAAAAVGCPQVVLFGKASTSLYRPWGTSGADVKVLTGRIGDEPTMLGIEPAAVIEAWEALRFRVRAAYPG